MLTSPMWLFLLGWLLILGALFAAAFAMGLLTGRRGERARARRTQPIPTAPPAVFHDTDTDTDDATEQQQQTTPTWQPR